MSIDRREFLELLVGGAVAEGSLCATVAHAAPKSRIKAIAFDAFPVFDPRPIFVLAEQHFPGKGAELSATWRTKQFDYQWLRALSGHYADFWQTTEEALVFSATSLKLNLTPAKRDELMNAYLALKAWPDAAPVLRSVKEAGIRMAFLSNFTPKMLDTAIGNAHLENLFEDTLSTDQIRSYKPDPRAYQMGIDAFGLRREEIAFVASAGWDATGAKWFGYPTVWINRMHLPAENLGVAPDAIGSNLNDLVAFVGTSAA